MLNVDATIFGGSFDPVQDGHMLVVKTLTEEAKSNPKALVAIATTFKNPWKTARELTALELRLSMWGLALTAAEIPWSRFPELGKVYLCDYQYEYSAEFIKWWRVNFKGSERWVTGVDSAGQEQNWKDWPELNVQMHALKVASNIHATDVREGLHPPLPAIREFIKAHKLFPFARW